MKIKECRPSKKSVCEKNYNQNVTFPLVKISFAFVVEENPDTVYKELGSFDNHLRRRGSVSHEFLN